MTQHITLYKQIHPCQCSALAKLGYKSLINLRFDDECDNQPTSDEIALTAHACKLNYHHLPIDGDSLHQDKVGDFAKLLANTPKPVMVFCGTGARAKRIYQSAVVLGLIG
ncbi:MAG: sulfur transferase domain-containing protein [Moraxella sp.]|nr:sulfur transferase domain-containing protein [Moraxella sp.]